MGYYIELIDSNFTIPADKLDEALEILKRLNVDTPAEQKRGGSWGGSGRTASWFSWMPEDYDKTVTSAAEVFELLGFHVKTSDDGALSLEGYDNKTGQEDLFINAVSHLANDDWHLTWRGEDGDTWRNQATGTRTGRVVFD